MTNFILIGVGGYVAARHLQAIKAVGGNLIAALDKNDSVGILDSYFPECDFFTDFEIFDRHVTMLQRKGITVHYVVVCSPNYLHDAHCRFGLRIGADVICEKPLCLQLHNSEALQEMEIQTGRRVYVILQLRLHPVIKELKGRGSIDLVYTVKRGNWYWQSWKGNEDKSGGIESNIGIHFFDMLISKFGAVESVNLVHRNKQFSGGSIKLERAHVNYVLNIGDHTNRQLKLNGELIEFNDGFTELHTESYREILAGRGFGIEDAKPAIELVERIRNYKQ